MKKWEKPYITILGLDKTKGADIPSIPTSDAINEDLLGETYKHHRPPTTSGGSGGGSSSSSSSSGYGHSGKPRA